MVTLRNTNQTVMVDSGELVSYSVDGYEFMHQKGNPGWGHTDTEMFPIIGPTEKAGYRVQVPKGNAIQDQHGLLRELNYTLEKQKEHEVSFIKEYRSGTLVQNSKFPLRSKARQLIWPFNFRFRKQFKLEKKSLEITFTVSGDRDMPYMLGYHPAFALRTSAARVISDNGSFSLEEVMAAGDRALQVRDTRRIVLEEERSLEIRTEGFGQFMLWSPVSNMICIEPITFYPYEVEQALLHEGFRFLDRTEENFTVVLTPMEN